MCNLCNCNSATLPPPHPPPLLSYSPSMYLKYPYTVSTESMKLNYPCIYLQYRTVHSVFLKYPHILSTYIFKSFLFLHYFSVCYFIFLEYTYLYTIYQSIIAECLNYLSVCNIYLSTVFTHCQCQYIYYFYIYCKVYVRIQDAFYLKYLYIYSTPLSGVFINMQ
jgi:hypothetical protein